MIVTQGYFELFYRLQKGLPAFQSAAGWPSLGKNPHQAGAAGSIARPRASWESGDQWLIGIIWLRS